MSKLPITTMDVETSGLDHAHSTPVDAARVIIRCAASDGRWDEYAAFLEAAGVVIERMPMPVGARSDQVVFAIGCAVHESHDVIARLAHALSHAGLADDRLVISVGDPNMPEQDAEGRPTPTRDERMELLGRMLDEQERRHPSGRSVYRLRPDRTALHVMTVGALTEKKGFDHRAANAAPRSQRRR
jgi:hypothetical protein